MEFVILFAVVAGIFLFLKVMSALDQPVVNGQSARSYRTSRKIQVNPVPETFIVFDTETTGLDSFKDSIIEIGAIKAHIGKDNHETFNALIKIDKKIPKKATEIHGITDDMLQKDGIPLETALNEFRNFIGDLPLVAYNADFDKEFINNAAERLGMKKIIKRPTCALKMARRAWPELENHKQGTVARHIGLDDKGLHRSLADCHATMFIYANAVNRLMDMGRGM